jgi:hypothetical protein
MPGQSRPRMVVGDGTGGALRLRHPRRGAPHTSATSAARDCAAAISSTMPHSLSARHATHLPYAVRDVVCLSRELPCMGLIRYARPARATRLVARDVGCQSPRRGTPSRSCSRLARRASFVRAVSRGVPGVISAARRSPMARSRLRMGSIVAPSVSPRWCGRWPTF